MSQKLTTSLLSVMILATILGVGSAYAETFDYQKCLQSTYRHCMEYTPQLNQVPLQATTNMHVEIHLPVNGAQVIDGVFSPDNFTSLKTSPFVGAVVNIYTTISNPTLNYCPVSKYILENQGTPEYLNKLYDPTKQFDLTGLVYSPMCYAETGPNPINGAGAPVVPEFPQVLGIVIAIATMSAIVFTTRRDFIK